MRERPILFSAEMVRALLAGRKTQTRRLVKAEHLLTTQAPDEVLGTLPPWLLDQASVYCPHGFKGDRLWVKECFAPCHEKENHAGAKAGFTYRADWSSDEEVSRDFRWRPSIFCTRAASRITLEIESVRAERLQAVSEADAQAEGVTHYCDDPKCEACQGEPNRKAYSYVWREIKGPGSWDANPWVWVITFKCIAP